MQYVFSVNVKDDPAAIAEYRQYHREVWPEVIQSLRRVGVQRMDIYLLGRRLVMVVEMIDGVDYSTAFRAHAASSPRVGEWERLMQTLQERPEEAQPAEWWARMEPVFHMDQEEPAVDRLSESARFA